MGPKGQGRESSSSLQPEMTEAKKREVLEEIESLKQAKSALATAISWLHGKFKQEALKEYINAEHSLADDPSLTKNFTALTEARVKVSQALSDSAEIQAISQIDISKFKHFQDYCIAHEIKKDSFNFQPLKPGQGTFNWLSYINKISKACQLLDRYMDSTLFFLTSKQADLPPTPPNERDKEISDEKPTKKHGTDTRPE